MPKTLKKRAPLAQVEGFHFDAEAHAYTLNGKALKGVTTILSVINKPALIQWAAGMACDYIRENVAYAIPGQDGGFWAIKPSTVDEAKVAHRKKKEAAGEAGTDVHAQIEIYIKRMIEHAGGISSPEPEYTGQAGEFINWAISNNVRFLASEQRLYSETLWYAGTADFVCEINGKMYVGDVKTSSAIYPEHFIQASAYAMALEEMHLFDSHNTPFDGVLIVNIPKKGGLNVQENYDIKGNSEAFKAALTLHNYLNK